MIDFLYAHRGGVLMYSKGSLKGWGKTAVGIAYTLKTAGLADCVMVSSSMDFTNEEGFETDDGAMLELKRAFELIRN